MIIVFAIIKAIFGLRVSEEEELEGLDLTEHGLASAYSGFSIMDMSNAMMNENENTNLGEADYDKASEAKKKAAVPVENITEAMKGTIPDTGINKVVIITKLSRYDKIKRALNELGVTGITVTQVSGCGIQKGAGEMYRGVEMDMTLLPKIKLEVVVSGIPVDSVIETAKRTLYTGKIGDGKIFVYPVSRVVKIRTGEENYDALQDVE
jgi:Amt family ammonium transporter